MSVNLVTTRNQIASGGIISASHMAGVYDVLISGSQATNDGKVFGGMRIDKDVIEMSGNTVSTTGVASGQNTHAIGNYSHAQGDGTQAIGNYSHAQGDGAQASEYASHAQGKVTQAIGQFSHAQGVNTVASGQGSHAQG